MAENSRFSFLYSQKRKKCNTFCQPDEKYYTNLKNKKIGEREKKRKKYYKFFPWEKRDSEKNGE